MNTGTLDLFQNILKSTITWKKAPVDPIRGVAVDSRKVRPFDLFFALPGEKTDGHLFIKEAIKNGARGIVVEKPLQEDLPSNIGVIYVKEGIGLLQELASLLLQSCSSTILALTGSIGKTTTREYAKALLGATGSVVSPKDNCNSQIGLAMSCINSLIEAKVPPRWFLAEMGMTENGNIAKLISAFPPKVALVTCVAPIHFHNFQMMQDVARAKGEIFQSPQCTTSLVNIDTACPETLLSLARGRVCTLSMKKKATYQLKLHDNSLVFVHEGKERAFRRPPLPAPHQYENLLHAMALAIEGGANIDAFPLVLEHLPVIPRRLEYIEKNNILFINDSYNAAVASTLAALGVLQSEKKEGRKIAILGQMCELGSLSHSSHETIGKRAKECADMLFAVGEECAPLVEAFKSSGKSCIWVQNVQELIPLLEQELKGGDTVLLKGSNSNRLWTIVDHFSKKGR